MSIKHNRSKMVSMKSQEGMASIVVVSILVVIITIISIGFARIMNRTINNSANRQFSSEATYAAQSAINDVASYISQAGNSNVYSDNCTGSGSLIGDSTSKGPFYYASNLSGDASKSAHYTCLLLNQTPYDVRYDNLSANKSRVVRVKTSAFQTATEGSLEKLLVSWRASDSSLTNMAPDCIPAPAPPVAPSGITYCQSSPLRDETRWNVDKTVPMLRMTIYPIPTNNDISDLEAKSKTIFLLPQDGVGNTPDITWGDIKDGATLGVHCTNTIAAGSFNPSTNSNYQCNIILDALTTSAVPGISYFYIRFTPIYNQVNIDIKANDRWQQQLKFVNTQAMIDATAVAGNAAKRLQARVDISSNDPSSNDIDLNVSPEDDGIPEQSIRSANALCKRVIDTQTPVFDYIAYDEPPNVCYKEFSTNFVAPTLNLSISGSEENPLGTFNNRSRDSAAQTPDASQLGTLYITANGSATVTWATTESTFCSGSDALPVPAGSSDVNDSMTFNNIRNVTKYTIVCGRNQVSNTSGSQYLAGPKTVTAWPPPRVSMSSSVNPPEAGQPYDVSWSSANAIRCVLSGDWPNNSLTGTSGSEHITWTQEETKDRNLSKIFMSECFDPAGRSAKTAITYNHSCPAGYSCVNGNPTFAPPTCSASVWFSGSTTSDAKIFWDTNCDYYDTPNWWEADRYINETKDGGNFWVGLASAGWMGKNTGGTRLTSSGTYCATVEVWAPNWTSQADADGSGPGPNGNGAANSGRQCLSVHDPLVETDFYRGPIWDEGAEGTCQGLTGVNAIYNSTWNCRYTKTTYEPGPCADGVHRWILCGDNGYSDVSAGSDPVSCKVTTNYGGLKSGGGSLSWNPPIGWVGEWSPTLTLDCSNTASGERGCDYRYPWEPGKTSGSLGSCS